VTNRWAASRKSFEKAGGQVVKELTLAFPNVEFQALLTEIAATKPDAVYTFFAGAGAVKFVKDYAGRRPEEVDPALRRWLHHGRHA
jgi:branched-chain amino acid transport system substrate-binding protein